MPSPTFSSNDQSRWAAVRALVDEGTFAIGRREHDAAGTYRDTGIIFEDGWKSVDKVLDPETHVFYSSKPPLLPGGWRILDDSAPHGLDTQEQPRKVVVSMLLTVNVAPLIVYLGCLARLLERYGTTDWGRCLRLPRPASARSSRRLRPRLTITPLPRTPRWRWSIPLSRTNEFQSDR